MIASFKEPETIQKIIDARQAEIDKEIAAREALIESFDNPDTINKIIEADIAADLEGLPEEIREKVEASIAADMKEMVKNFDYKSAMEEAQKEVNDAKEQA